MMRNVRRAPPLYSGYIQLPMAIQHIIDGHYSQMIALAWRGYEHHGRGAIAITADGFMGYFTATELQTLMGADGQAMQVAIAAYPPETEIVVCILAVDPPYGLILRRDALSPLASAQRISQARYSLTPSA